MQTLRPTIGDAVVQQFTRDWEALSRELRELEAMMSNAGPGLRAGALQRLEGRVSKLSATFDRQLALFGTLFSGEWSARPDVQRLQRTTSDIGSTIARILGVGHPRGPRTVATGEPPRRSPATLEVIGPPEYGPGSFAEIVAEIQSRQQYREAVMKASVGVKTPAYTLPGVPPAAAANPVLAIAIVLDVVWHLLLGKKR